MTPKSPYERFSRSKAGFVVFVALMAVCWWFSFRFFRESLQSPVTYRSDSGLSFVVIIIAVIWVQTTRLFSFWTRWIVPIVMFVVCGCLAHEGAAHLQNATTQDDQGWKAILSYAGFFGVALLWIVAVPVEETIYRGGAVPRGRLKFWPLGFALAGLIMIASASVLFVHYVMWSSPQPAEYYLVVARNSAIYLGLGFCVLAIARLFLPLLRTDARTRGVVLGFDENTEG
jgi:hypothetical protein